MPLIDLIWVVGGIICAVAFGFVILNGKISEIGTPGIIVGGISIVIMLGLGFISRIASKMEGDKSILNIDPKAKKHLIAEHFHNDPPENLAPGRRFKDFLWWVFFIGLFILGTIFAFPDAWRATH